AFHRLDGGPPHSSPLDRLDLVLVAGLAALTCGLNMIRLTHWNFTAVGDEGEFFRLAKAISQASYRWNPFNLAGVYGDHPVLDSLIQAAGLKAFGVDAFGWRMAEVLVVAASTALVYVLARILIGRVAATCAGL